MNKKSIRASFRREVFSRAKYQCELCKCRGYDKQDESAKKDGQPLDAHHIQPREDIPNGGYVRSNGISLCPTCHICCEMYLSGTMTDEVYSPKTLYAIIGSSFEKALEDSSKLVTE